MSLPARWFGLRTVSDRHGAPSQGRSPTKEGYCPEPARGSRGRPAEFQALVRLNFRNRNQSGMSSVKGVEVAIGKWP